MIENFNCNPTVDIKETLAWWEDYKKESTYGATEDAVARVFGDKSHFLDDSDIMIKAAVLNDFYSTNIRDVYGVMKHYKEVKNLGERLEKGDISLVAELTPVRVKDRKNDGEKVINFYSFATKFCCQHNKEAFPIYDSIAGEMLIMFRKRDNFCSFKNVDLKNYKKYVEIYKQFQSFYKLEKYTFRQIDWYLWLTSKDLNGMINIKRKENAI
ncbi:MAG: hypothetical protein IJ213_05210 [Bacteroidales bacterium]|nr:hypothetical protein [Bacteroidales bacterium]